jgi:sugar lactone lactonase YvrE
MPLHLLDNLINLSDQTTARLNLGLGTTDTPTFNGITLTSDLSVGGSATVTNSITANTINAIEYDVTGTDGVITSTKDIRGWAFGSKATPTLTADATPQGVYFKPDGSVMYVAGSTTRRVYAYNLSPAWDVSTASATPTLSTVQLDNGLEGLAFSPDGKYLFTVSSSTDNVKRYTMTSGNEWDISTVSATPDKTFYLGVGVPRGIYFKPDGTRMYVFDDNNNTTTEYIMTSGNEWDISTATVGSSLVTIDATFGLAFSDDGKQLFFNTLTRIYQY